MEHGISSDHDRGGSQASGQAVVVLAPRFAPLSTAPPTLHGRAGAAALPPRVAQREA